MNTLAAFDTGQDPLPVPVAHGVGVSRAYDDDYAVTLHFASRVSRVGAGGVAYLTSVEALALYAHLGKILDV